MARRAAACWRRGGSAAATRSAAAATIRCPDAHRPTSFPGIAHVNEQRNLILALVLSASCCSAGCLVSDAIFPTANTPSTEIVNGKQVALPSVRAPVAGRPARGQRDRAVVLAQTPRVRIDDAAARRLDQPQGRADRRSGADHAARDDRQEFAARPPVLARTARRTPISRASAGPARASRCPTPTRVWTASRQRARARQAGDADAGTTARARASRSSSAIDDGYLFTVQQSVTNGAQAPIQARTYSLVNRAGRVEGPVDAGRRMSARSARSAASRQL